MHPNQGTSRYSQSLYTLHPRPTILYLYIGEKLNAVQQLTAMIIPPSTVNMMSNDEDHSFQCQEQGHIARNCPTLGVSNVMSMVTLSWIVHIGYLLWEPQQNITNPDLTEATPTDQDQDTTMMTGTGEVIPGHNLIFTDVTAQVIMTHIEATPGHDIGITAATPGVAHDAHTPHTEITVINPTMIHHTNIITDCPHIKAPQLTTPEIIVDPVHIHPTNPLGEICTGHIHIPADHKGNHNTRRTLE